MEFKWKRRLSFFVIGVFMFLDGIEYAVIFPTLWEYLLSLGIDGQSQVYYLGVCISALTVTDMIVGLFVGRFVDKHVDSISKVLLLLNLFLVASNVLYMSAARPAHILVSRLIGGVGNVASVALLAEVSRSTSHEERTPVLIGFNIAQQIGLLFGPACNLFLRTFDFELFGLIRVDKLNAPGFFMAVLYLALEVVIFCGYFDLSKEFRRLNTSNENTQNSDSQQQRNNSDDIQPAEPEFRATWTDYIDELLRGEIIAVILLRFIALFGQTCLETIVTPFMRTYFDYGDFENSLLYLLGGVELLIMSVAMGFLSKRISDRNFVFFGALLHILTLIWCLAVFPFFRKDDRSGLPYFGVAVFLDLASVSIVLDIGLSLLTKMVSDEVQGFATGFRRFISNLAMLLGPLWGSGALPWLPALFAVPLAVMIIATLLFMHSYSKMVPRTRIATSVPEAVPEVSPPEVIPGSEVDEETPLLSHSQVSQRC